MICLLRSSLWCLLFLLSKNANLRCAEIAVYKLDESDILQAKLELETSEYHNKVLQYSLIATGASLTGLVLFKAWQNYGVQIPATTVSLENKDSNNYFDLEKRVLRLEQLDTSDQPMIKRVTQNVKNLVLINGPIILLQQGLTRVGNVFGEENLKKRLGKINGDLTKHFERLKIAQIQYDPQAFANNMNYKNDLKICLYAQQVANNFSKMSIDKIIELREEAQAVLIDELNYIIKQMAYVIACIRYSSKIDKMQPMLDNCANQLYLTSYDLACKIEAALINKDVCELFDAISLLQSTFNITISNVLIFGR